LSPLSLHLTKSRCRWAQQIWRRRTPKGAYPQCRSLQMIPFPPRLPSRSHAAPQVRLSCTAKQAAVSVAAAQSQRRLPACFQPVSSTFLTGACCTADNAWSWAWASAAVMSAS